MVNLYLHKQDNFGENQMASVVGFVSQDGTDEDGVRAQVHVIALTGTVKEIKEKSDKGVADVYFSVGKLTFPIHGWIGLEEPVFALAKTAYENGDEVDFRIEFQRKPKVDRKTPIEELRKDTSTALANIKVLLVGINELRTPEAVTNPAEDPKGTNGRYVASETDLSKPAGNNGSAASSFSKEEVLASLALASANAEVRPSILDGLAAQALLHGASVEEVNVAIAGRDKRENGTTVETPRANYAQEAPAWKEYNSDGRLNLGSSIVAAGVGAETLISKQLTALGLADAPNIAEVTDYFTDLVFAIADRVQVSAYGNGARSDRAAGSHTRIRGILYEVISNQSTLPVVLGSNGAIQVNNPDDLKNWIAETGKLTVAKFNRAIRASQATPGFGQIVPPASLTGGTVAARPSSPAAPQSPPEAPSQPVRPQPQVVTRPDSVPAPVTPPDLEPDQPETVAVAQPEEESLDSVQDEVTPTENLEGVLPPRKLTSDELQGETASEDTIAALKELMSESGLDPKDVRDLTRISHVLAYTFGSEFSNPKKVPDDALLEFIDWYVGNGSEALNNAMLVSRDR